MKIYIQSDIEGVAGFCFFEDLSNHTEANFNHIQRMRKLLTSEVNAAVKASFDSGADEVFVNDSHGAGYNIIFEELDKRCRIIHGRNCSGPHWLPKLDESFDAMILVGMHAMGGTPGAIVSHSKWEVNDGEIYLSEGSMAAAIAGDHEVPTIFVSGDNFVTTEISEKIPGIEVVVSKEALSPYQACSLIPVRCCELIYDGVKRAIRRRLLIEPFKIDSPVKLNLLDNAEHIPPFEYCGKAVCADTIDEAFMKYERAMNWTHFDSKNVDGYKFPGK